MSLLWLVGIAVALFVIFEVSKYVIGYTASPQTLSRNYLRTKLKRAGVLPVIPEECLMEIADMYAD